MAEQANAVAHHHGDMPIQAQASTYKSVMELFKWGALGTADLMILLVMWFCTPAGFLPAIIVAIIVLALGIFGLRTSKTAAH